MRRVGPVANIHKIGTVLLVEHVEPTYTPIQVHHQVNAIIVLGAVQVHAGTRCQVDCGIVARTLSSSCTWSLGITFERDRGILIEAEGGVLAYEVTQAIHHMRVIDHKSESAIATSAPG